MSWWRISLPRSEVPVGRYAALQGTVSFALAVAGMPAEAAMIENTPVKSEEHHYYLSPDAFVILKRWLEPYSPVECGAPPLEDSVLLVGKAGAHLRLLSNATKAGK